MIEVSQFCLLNILTLFNSMFLQLVENSLFLLLYRSVIDRRTDKTNTKRKKTHTIFNIKLILLSFFLFTSSLINQFNVFIFIFLIFYKCFTDNFMHMKDNFVKCIYYVFQISNLNNKKIITKNSQRKKNQMINDTKSEYCLWFVTT